MEFNAPHVLNTRVTSRDLEKVLGPDEGDDDGSSEMSNIDYLTKRTVDDKGV